jgi:hypothetical protein
MTPANNIDKRASAAQIAANRANSQHSTGPSSDSGRAKVSLNSIKHGFASKVVVVLEHEREAYLAHFANFREEYQAVGPTEDFLVHSLADLSWAIQSIRAEITTYLSMQASRDTGAYTGDNPEDNAAITQAENLEAHARALNTLGIYEQRKMRLFAAARKDLVQLQAERKAKQQLDLEAAAEYRETAKIAKSDWNPAEFGFACSAQECDRFILRRNLLNAAAHRKSPPPSRG